MNKHSTTQLQFHYTLPRLRLYWRGELEQAAREHGYTSVERAMIDIYRRTNSMAKTARLLATTRQTVRRTLTQLGEPIGPPGGNNNPWGRAGKPASRKSRNAEEQKSRR